MKEDKCKQHCNWSKMTYCGISALLHDPWWGWHVTKMNYKRGISPILHVKVNLPFSCESSIMSSLIEGAKSEKSDIAWAKQKAALQTWSMEFQRRGHLSGRKCLTKDAIEVHYGKCRIHCFWISTVRTCQPLLHQFSQFISILAVANPNFMKVQYEITII